MANTSGESQGLRFQKLDLHTHTPASKCFGDSSVTPKDVVDAALAAGLSGIAITDHNSGEWIDQVKDAAKGTALTVFPGVEITCMGGVSGIHIIALFSPDLGRADIESLLGELGLKPKQYGDISTVVEKDPITVVRVVSDRGGLAVLAHVNSSKGALHDMKGQQRINLIQSQYVAAVETTDFQNADLESKKKRAIDLLDGSDPDYQRKLAVYQASDSPSGNNDGVHALVGLGTRCSYFKLDHLDLDGLGQCFADPDVRIRQDFEYQTTVYPTIAGIKVTGGFLDGIEATFHDGLNSILGAKGAGKSLLVEFLRFALDQGSENKDVATDHESKLDSRLELYSTVTVVLKDETGKEFSVTREYNPVGGHPYMGDEHPDVRQLFPVLFLSQNEIIKIAENDAEQIRFIDRFLDFRRFQQQIADHERELIALDSRLAEALRAYSDSRQIVSNVQSIKKELAELDQGLKNPIFDKFSQLETKDRTLREHLSYLANLGTQTLSHKETLTTTPVLPEIPDIVSADPAVKRLQGIITKAKQALIDSVDEIIAGVENSRTAANAEYAKWAPMFKTGSDEYDAAVQQSGGDYKKLAQRRAQRIRELEQEEARLAAYKTKSDRVTELVNERNDRLSALRKLYQQFSDERQARCQNIEKQSNGRLRVSIRSATNVEEFRKRLSKLKKGSWLRDVEIESISNNSSPSDFVRAVVRYTVFGQPDKLEQLAQTAGIDKDRMISLAAFLKDSVELEELLSLEHQALPQDRPEIQYNVGGSTFASLKQLSVGQKCTAMLVIALSEGTTPIVIDQPEDSLDIRSIWDDMCSKIRTGKECRQFIFTTHNSSLAVASDTDKFIVLEADANHGKVSKTGSMDHSPMKEEVIEYLEGGEKTYRQKSDKYRLGN